MRATLGSLFACLALVASGCSVILDAGEDRDVNDTSSDRAPCLQASFGPDVEAFVYEDTGQVRLDNSAISPTLPADQSLMYFTYTVNSSAQRDVWVATRVDTGTLETPTFVNAHPVAELNDPLVDETNVQVSRDGTVLRFARGDGPQRVYESRLEGDTWSTPVEITEILERPELYPPRPLDDPSLEVFAAVNGSLTRLASLDAQQNAFLVALPDTVSRRTPWVSHDGHVMFFAVEPVSIDLAWTSRSGVDQEWGEEHVIEELVTDRDERGAWLSDDLCTIYFARRMYPESGDSHIFVARRTP